ncbi:MAG: tetraacyldisaccharide 4'-kinase [Wenzhouxiangellaceae bacterium]|nr:tetraacyldisaccharide 4'-kinase [Wenzhouxiangellaceae bacterium]
MREFVARKLERIWYGQELPPLALRLAAGLYRGVTQARLQRPVGRPPCPVIVVGNLAVGGSGKTPVVAAIAKYLQNNGLAVAIISRGYGGAEPRRPLQVTADTPVARSGDEALELALKTGLPVWVCSRRRRALEAARRHGAMVVVSDDGLQHVDLQRSFEICLVDGRRGFGNGRLLPAGPLRQPVRRLESVDLVLVKDAGAGLSSSLPPGEYRGARFQIEPTGIQPLPEAHGASSLRPPEPPQTIDAVAGIADPEPFFSHLEARGFSLRRHRLGDHQAISPTWIESLAGPVVMTVKDAMRLGPCGRQDLFMFEVDARLPGPVLEKVLNHVREFLS